MHTDSPAPTFSVVLATRDRPKLFAAALASVLGQIEASLEVIVVNDGSSDTFRPDYDTIERSLAAKGHPPARFIALERLSKGHGQSYTRNEGARHASGRFICFLDDDDVWTDMAHLARVQAMIGATPGVELLLFDQAAFRKEERLAQPIWLEDLGVSLKAAGTPSVGGFYHVTPDQLLTAVGFAHVNATIVSAGLFRRVTGFNEALHYEDDRDFYLRVIDEAQAILYCPVTVARHNVPEPALASNTSTRMRPLEKHLSQFTLLNHAVRTARHRAIRDYARGHRRAAIGKALNLSRSVKDRLRFASVVLGGLLGPAGWFRGRRGG